jgi:hypothetical protein
MRTFTFSTQNILHFTSNLKSIIYANNTPTDVVTYTNIHVGIVDHPVMCRELNKFFDIIIYEIRVYMLGPRPLGRNLFYAMGPRQTIMDSIKIYNKFIILITGSPESRV